MYLEVLTNLPSISYKHTIKIEATEGKKISSDASVRSFQTFSFLNPTELVIRSPQHENYHLTTGGGWVPSKT